LVVLAGLAVALGLPLLRAAHAAGVAGPRAVRLVAFNGKRLSGEWQRWANASLVPTVAGQVTVRLSGCPGLPRVAGCVYTAQPRVVYLKPGIEQPRGVMLHELGHVYDLTVLSNRDRGQFRRIMRRPHARWWEGKTPLAEWFAEAYSWCARYSRIVSVSRYAIYDYDPTATQHRDTCSLIKRVARDRTPPAPAPAPPVLTGDPTPPTSPPVTPAVVPGDPVRDPGPAPVENQATRSTPTPTPTPTASPRPVRTASPTPTVVIPTPTPTPVATPEETPEPEPTEEPTPEPTETATPTPTPTPTPTATPDDTPEPEPTGEPTPDPTPVPYRGHPH
jgi:hypothetical protein